MPAAVLQRLMPAFDLALRLGMVGRTADVLHALAVQPFSEIGGEVGRTIVRQQSRPMNDGDVVEASGRQGEIEGSRHVLGPHGRTDSARMVAQSFQATMKREKSSSTVER